jgi:hypothetical protein
VRETEPRDLALLAWDLRLMSGIYMVGGIHTTPLSRARVAAALALAKSESALRAKPIVYGKLGPRNPNGKLLEKLPPIYGDGEHDDAPGLSALVDDRYAFGKPCPILPADRLYRLESPITATRGALVFTPAGSRYQMISFPHHRPVLDLSSAFEPGEVRFFWFDFANGDPENDNTLCISSVMKDSI